MCNTTVKLLVLSFLRVSQGKTWLRPFGRIVTPQRRGSFFFITPYPHFRCSHTYPYYIYKNLHTPPHTLSLFLSVFQSCLCKESCLPQIHSPVYFTTDLR
ncbi:hypothetical protein L1887_16295 [Cichorium endivia]|nr:hypothetical protein L1887_16295 [Cichorium endivia]